MADSVERVIAGWAASRPQLDVSPIAVIARLARVHEEVRLRIAPVLRRHGLSTPDFAVLATLIRVGEPSVSQSRLMRELNLTAGTVSVRVDRLARAGLVTRRPDPDDRRGTHVALTERGREAFESAAPEHLANMETLLAALDAEECEQLAMLLGKWLDSLEEREGA